jgi:16S rRNA (adenine1518-N6/adenine1519-N6)-dimethyltransferase
MSESFITHKPRKRFGQNFLTDPNIIRRIVSAIAPKKGQRLLEIGPGQGAITRYLLQYEADLTAVELDRDLAAILRNMFAAETQFHLVEGDALALDIAAIASPDKPVRIVGNLPYNISTPLLFHLLKTQSCIVDMHFMLQKEVVDRLAAAPGSKDYGRLTVMVQYHCDVVPVFDVPPGAFYPPPKVMSAIVRLQPRPPKTMADNLETLSQVVNAAFQQRRKTLRNTLKLLMPESVIVAAGIDPSARAETLSVSQFVGLANTLESLRLESR